MLLLLHMCSSKDFFLEASMVVPSALTSVSSGQPPCTGGPLPLSYPPLPGGAAGRRDGATRNTNWLCGSNLPHLTPRLLSHIYLCRLHSVRHLRPHNNLRGKVTNPRIKQSASRNKTPPFIRASPLMAGPLTNAQTSMTARHVSFTAL